MQRLLCFVFASLELTVGHNLSQRTSCKKSLPAFEMMINGEHQAWARTHTLHKFMQIISMRQNMFECGVCWNVRGCIISLALLFSLAFGLLNHYTKLRLNAWFWLADRHSRVLISVLKMFCNAIFTDQIIVLYHIAAFFVN